jgi:hypothetical protein
MADKGMAQILKTRGGMMSAWPPPKLATQPAEGVLDSAHIESGPARGEKEHLLVER